MSAQQHIETDVQPTGTIKELSSEEAHELFDRMAQFNLDISGDEFLRRWDAGEYQDLLDDVNVKTMKFYMLLVRDKR